MKYSRIYTLFVVAFIAWSVYQIVISPLDVVVCIGVALLVYLYTDILSGLLHIILDNERSLELPVIDGLARGFQSHHESPKDIYQMSIYNHLYVMHLPLTIMFPIAALGNSSLSYFVYLSLAVSLHLMQMSHRWAHSPKNMLNPTILFFQKMRLLLPRKLHQIHHNNVFDTNFCIMNGWFNPTLNALVRVFGKTSHAWIAVFLLLTISLLLSPAFIS